MNPSTWHKRLWLSTTGLQRSLWGPNIITQGSTSGPSAVYLLSYWVDEFCFRPRVPFSRSVYPKLVSCFESSHTLSLNKLRDILIWTDLMWMKMVNMMYILKRMVRWYKLKYNKIKMRIRPWVCLNLQVLL